MVNAELRVVSGKHSGNVIPLPAGRFLIGREEDCHLRPNSDLVSRHHCVFHTDDYTLRLRDLGSTNGTLVNGERLRGEVVLNDGDKISVGQLEFEVQIREGAAAADVVQPGTIIDAGDSSTGDATETILHQQEPSSSQTQEEMPVVGGEPASLHDTSSFQNDTVLQPIPGQYPAYPQQMPGYPMQYPQMAYPYGMPMMYPQQQMHYPMGMYPQQQMPMAPAPQPEPATEDSRSVPELTLPHPSTTGAKAPEQPAPGEAGKSKEATVTDTAGQIIKQYLQRRPQ